MHVGVAAEEPQQLVDDGLEVQLLGGEAGEAVVQAEAHLMAEDAQSPRARTVFLVYTLVEDALEEV